MPATLKDQSWIVLAAGVIFLTNLGGAALWDLDEALYATCARGMWERGDWIVPELPPPFSAEKPPLMFWMMMAGFGAFGVTEFAARLPAALCGIGTALIVYHLGRRFFSREAGLWAGLITASTLIFTVSARAATVDSALTLLTTAAIGLFAAARNPVSRRVLCTQFRDSLLTCQEIVGWAERSESHRNTLHGGTRCARPTLQQGVPATKSSEEFQGKNDNKLSAWGGWAAVWTLFALAVLAKGPIAMLLPAAVIGLFLMIVNHRASEQQRPSRAATWTAWIGEWLRFVGPTNFLRSLWQMRPISGTLIVLAVAGTWFVLVGWRTDGAWPSEFFLKNNLLRFAEPAQGHGGGPWYYIVALLVGFFPWAVFLGPTAARVARRARRDDPDHPIYLLLLCWIGIWFVFWSLCSTKLPHYILPMYPAVALLTGDFLASWRRADERCVAWWVHSSGATMVVVGLGAAVALPIVTHMFVPDETWLTAIALVPILGGAAWWRLAATGRRGPALAAFATTAVLLLVAVFAVGAARVGRYRNAPWLARTIADQGATHDDVAAYRFFRHSWAYYLGGPIPELRDQKQIDAFLHATDGGYVVTRQDDAERLLDEFPDRLIEVSRQRRFLESEDLVLLGSRPRFTAERVRHRIEQR